MKRPNREAAADIKYNWLKRVGILFYGPCLACGVLLLSFSLWTGFIFLAVGAVVLAFEYFRLAVKDVDSFPPNWRL